MGINLKLKSMKRVKLSLQIKALITLAVFLIAMFILTIVSRHADELITAQIETVSPRPMVINNINYLACVPVEVLHSEGDKTYVFIASGEETVLGIKTVAERVNVTVKDENESYAAIDGGFINSQEFILSSNKPVEPGDRVHLKN